MIIIVKICKVIGIVVKGRGNESWEKIVIKVVYILINVIFFVDKLNFIYLFFF